MNKKFAAWLMAISISLVLVGCGSSNSDSTANYAADKGAYADQNASLEARDSAAGFEGGEVATAAVAPDGGVSEGKSSTSQAAPVNSNVSNNRKVIFTGQIDFQTLNYEKTRTDLCNYMKSIGAYTQNSSEKGAGIGYDGLKSSMYVFRVPKMKYEQAFVDLGKFGTVVFQQSTGEDVSGQYFDTEARVKTLKIQQERLLALLEKATRMEDILKIEKELQTTNYEIETLTGTLKKWDSLVDYSTLTVNITEVEQLKPTEPTKKDGFFTRIAVGFKNSVVGLWKFLQDTIVFIAAALPILLPLGAIVYVVYRIIRKRTRKQLQMKNSEALGNKSPEQSDK